MEHEASAPIPVQSQMLKNVMQLMMENKVARISVVLLGEDGLAVEQYDFDVSEISSCQTSSFTFIAPSLFPVYAGGCCCK